MSHWFSRLLDPDLASYTAGGVYAFVWALVFLETAVLVLFWLPGDTVLFTAGLIAGAPGSGISVALLASGTVFAAIAGDVLAYTTGRRLGRPWLERRPAKVLRHLERAEAFYERHGSWAVVACRFIPWARVFVPVLAGVARMPYRRFAAANLLGALVWGGGLPLVGYLAYQMPAVHYVAYAVAAVAVAASVVVPVVARVRSRRTKGRERGTAPDDGGAAPQG